MKITKITLISILIAMSTFLIAQSDDCDQYEVIDEYHLIQDNLKI